MAGKPPRAGLCSPKYTSLQGRQKKSVENVTRLPNIHHDCYTTVGNTQYAAALSLQCCFFSPPSLTTLVAPLCCLHCRNWHLTNRSLNKYIYICIYKQHRFAVSVRKRPASSSAALQLHSLHCVSQFCSDLLEFERSKSPTARKKGGGAAILKKCSLIA